MRSNFTHLFILSFSIFTMFIFQNVNAQENSNSNFYLDTWIAKNFPIPQQTTPLTFDEGTAGDSVIIYPHDTLAPFLPTQLGLNTTFRSGSDMVKKRVPLYRESQMGAFRFPAGSGSNLYFWDGNIPDKFLIDINPIDATQNSALKVSEFVAFIDSLGAEGTIVINYFYARYGFTEAGTREARVVQAAEYAAGFVNYVNNVLKANIKNWEVGNECYGKWETGYDVNGSIVTGKEYGEDFRVFAEKMIAVDPSIKIGAVMYPKDDNWNNEVMKEMKNDVDFLVVHNYFTTENDATADNILSSTNQVNEIKEQMDACTERNTSFPANHFPVSMTEYNCRGAHTTTFVNACFTADVVGRLIESGYGLATRWVGEWKWRVGTHGLFALDDPDQDDYSVRQAYMVYRYFGKCFGDMMVKTSSSNNKLTVYGSTFSDGKTGLVVINSTSGNISFNLNIKEGNNLGKVFLYEVYANTISESDKKFYVNGLTSNTSGGGPENPGDILPYEAELKENTILSVKKYSVNFFVFENSATTSSIHSSNQEKELIIYPNPAVNKLNFLNSAPFNSVKIYNLMGREVMDAEYKNPFDISAIPGGVYLLNLYRQSTIITKTFIKNN